MKAAEEALQAKEKVVVALLAGLQIYLVLSLFSWQLFVHLFGQIFFCNLGATCELMIISLFYFDLRALKCCTLFL